jgi:hypothetical protein
VANNVDSITVTGTANHVNATVLGNGQKSLTVGNNVVTIKVTAEDGTTTKSYTVTVVRAASTASADATLKALTVSVGKLTPEFAAGTTSYTVNISNSATNISVSGTVNHDSASVNNVTDTALTVGNNIINIVVTAENGTTTKTYTVTVIRDAELPGTDAEIVTVVVNDKDVSPEESTIEYVADCGETSVSLDLETSPYSTVTIDGQEYVSGQDIALDKDVTTANIRIEAETGAVQNYTFKATKAIESNSLYYQRWSDVIAINRNPSTNGGYTVSDNLWYGKDGATVNSWYIQIQGPVNDYHAEIKVNNDWHHVCGTVDTKNMSEMMAAYPNPVPRGESVKLHLPYEFIGGQLDIFGVTGSLVKSKIPLPVATNSIDVQDLPSGIYLFNVTGKYGDKESVKIIIE